MKMKRFLGLADDRIVTELVAIREASMSHGKVRHLWHFPLIIRALRKYPFKSRFLLVCSCGLLPCDMAITYFDFSLMPTQGVT